MSTPVETVLCDADLELLRVIAGTMVPADATLALPGADDPAILADIATSLGRDLPLIREALAVIAATANGAFAALDRDAREALVNRLHATRSAPFEALGRAILASYYRDGRVLAALGLEAGPPFPKGFTVEQGDWSLLDAVRGRPQLWRDDR